MLCQLLECNWTVANANRSRDDLKESKWANRECSQTSVSPPSPPARNLTSDLDRRNNGPDIGNQRTPQSLASHTHPSLSNCLWCNSQSRIADCHLTCGLVQRGSSRGYMMAVWHHSPTSCEGERALHHIRKEEPSCISAWQGPDLDPPALAKAW